MVSAELQQALADFKPDCTHTFVQLCTALENEVPDVDIKQHFSAEHLDIIDTLVLRTCVKDDKSRQHLKALGKTAWALPPHRALLDLRSAALCSRSLLAALRELSTRVEYSIALRYMDEARDTRHAGAASRGVSQKADRTTDDIAKALDRCSVIGLVRSPRRKRKRGHVTLHEEEEEAKVGREEQQQEEGDEGRGQRSRRRKENIAVAARRHHPSRFSPIPSGDGGQSELSVEHGRGRPHNIDNAPSDLDEDSDFDHGLPLTPSSDDLQLQDAHSESASPPRLASRAASTAPSIPAPEFFEPPPHSPAIALEMAVQMRPHDPNTKQATEECDDATAGQTLIPSTAAASRSHSNTHATALPVPSDDNKDPDNEDPDHENPGNEDPDIADALSTRAFDSLGAARWLTTEALLGLLTLFNPDPEHYFLVEPSLLDPANVPKKPRSLQDSHRILLFAFSNGGVHWTLGIFDRDRRCLEVYDPLNQQKLMDDTRSAIQRFLNSGLAMDSSTPIIQAPANRTLQQGNNYDCGIFCAVYGILSMLGKAVAATITPRIWRHVGRLALADKSNLNAGVFELATSDWSLPAAFTMPSSQVRDEIQRAQEKHAAASSATLEECETILRAAEQVALGERTAHELRELRRAQLVNELRIRGECSSAFRGISQRLPIPAKLRKLEAVVLGIQEAKAAISRDEGGFEEYLAALKQYAKDKFAEEIDMM